MFEEYKDKNVEEIVGLAEALSRRVNNHYFDLGELLFFIKENDIYKNVDDGSYSDDKAGWRRFCDDKLDIGYRTAQYWLNIYQYFFGMLIDRKELEGIGWSKAKEIVDATENAKHLKDILDYAKDNSLADLREYLAKYKAANLTEENVLGKFETIKFKMADYQMQQVNDAIVLAKEVFDVAEDSQALAAMALDWQHLKVNTDQLEDSFI